MECPTCGLNMVREKSGITYTTNPACWEERWWCKCGYKGSWEVVREKTQEEKLSDEWDRANHINDVHFPV